ncbi:MAG: tRNA (guanosine(46)-N7)-methyltransferase TrmB, partial [Muribaculaceae bacterium]|nr:tRNA (guanosine(46)-N7)-methyltransferase TrmB [Muribaculaceae bacterium]
MGKNKLKKFADMKGFRCALEYPREELLKNGFPHKGSWNGGFFTEERPIVVELGCGKGEYTVG